MHINLRMRLPKSGRIHPELLHGVSGLRQSIGGEGTMRKVWKYALCCESPQ
jgi:hypothetical protein